MTEIPANFKHQEFHKAIANFMKKWAGHMSSAEMLAVFAYALGQTVALQDQRTMTPDMALELISKNIEAGNKFVLDKFSVDGLTQQ